MKDIILEKYLSLLEDASNPNIFKEKYNGWNIYFTKEQTYGDKISHAADVRLTQATRGNNVISEEELLNYSKKFLDQLFFSNSPSEKNVYGRNNYNKEFKNSFNGFVKGVLVLSKHNIKVPISVINRNNSKKIILHTILKINMNDDGKFSIRIYEKEFNGFEIYL